MTSKSDFKTALERRLPAGCVLPVSKHYDAELRWHAEFVEAPIVPPSATVKDTHALPDPPFPHLRSSAAILGYRVLATDHTTGHVDDLILDENAWQIRYLVISKRLWWPGKKFLLPLTQVDRLDFGRKSVSLRLSRKIIEGAPEYQSSTYLEPGFAMQLSKYYQQKRNRT